MSTRKRANRRETRANIVLTSRFTDTVPPVTPVVTRAMSAAGSSKGEVLLVLCRDDDEDEEADAADAYLHSHSSLSLS